MWKVETTKFKKPKGNKPYISETTRFVPEIHIHPKTVFIKGNKKIPKKKMQEIIDYGITREQFLSILDKAAQPIKEDKD